MLGNISLENLGCLHVYKNQVLYILVDECTHFLYMCSKSLHDVKMSLIEEKISMQVFGAGQFWSMRHPPTARNYIINFLPLLNF